MPILILAGAVIIALGIMGGLIWGGTDRFKTDIDSRFLPWSSETTSLTIPAGGRMIKNVMPNGDIRITIFKGNGEIVKDEVHSNPTNRSSSPAPTAVVSPPSTSRSVEDDGTIHRLPADMERELRRMNHSVDSDSAAESEGSDDESTYRYRRGEHRLRETRIHRRHTERRQGMQEVRWRGGYPPNLRTGYGGVIPHGR